VTFDNLWEPIQNLLLGPEEIVGRSAKDNCFFVGAVLYGYRAVIPNQRLAREIWGLLGCPYLF